MARTAYGTQPVSGSNGRSNTGPRRPRGGPDAAPEGPVPQGVPPASGRCGGRRPLDRRHPRRLQQARCEGGGGSTGPRRSRSPPSRARSRCRSRSDPIAADTPPESGPLVLYNWADYIWKQKVSEFSEEFGVDVEITTFNNMEEGIQKVLNGQVTPDVFVPTPGYLRRLVGEELLQPLQHELIPNMEASVWPSYSNPGPYYDLDWNYTVPYTIYTWGVAYRRDHVDDDTRRGEGLGPPLGPGLRRVHQPVRLVRRHDRDHDPAQRQPRCEHGRPGADRPRRRTRSSRRSPRTRPGSRSTACTRSCPPTSSSGRVVVRRHRRSPVVPAEAARSGTSSGYWRPPNGQTMIGNDLLAVPTTAEEPAAGARVHQLLPRRHERVRELHQLERLPAAVHRRSTPTGSSTRASCLRAPRRRS